jgi:O-antigen/teichoic acid export membrane protein
MPATTIWRTLPGWLAGVWLLSAVASAVAAPVIIATVPYWHTVRIHLMDLGQWQAWISIAACVGLMVFSRRKYAEHEEGWAQGALLIYVIGGLLTAIVMTYGVLPQWLVHSSSMAKTAQVVVLVVLHVVCAACTWRSLRKWYRTA